MSISRISGVRIKGVASAVPERLRSVQDDSKVFGESEVQKISEGTGVISRYVATGGLCTSDLCFAAAERLLEASGWNRDCLNAVIFVSQTPDYLLPATSCSLQYRLGLSKQCAAFDMNLGCSGYVYGLWIASNLIASRSAGRVLLLVGDTVTRIVSPQDRSAALLFGDAGTATLLESDNNASPMTFVLGTDGAGQNNLIVPAGGFRHPHSDTTSVRTVREGGNIRCDEDIFMDGAEIFTFTLSTVPPMIKSLLTESAWEVDSVDAIVMHQANKFILEYLAKRMKLPKEKVVLAMKHYGNTSSASIPLSLTVNMSERLMASELRLVFAGFGVGYSYGAVALSCGPICMPEIVFVSESL